MSSDFVLVGASFHMILLGDGQAADWPELTMDREVLEPHPPLGLWLFTGMHTGLAGIRLTYRPPARAHRDDPLSQISAVSNMEVGWAGHLRGDWASGERV